MENKPERNADKPAIQIQDLTDLVMENEEFRSLSKLQDVYCPFDALGVSRAEIRHSNFLSDIINPNKPHGFGDVFLRQVVERLLTLSGYKNIALEMHLNDIGKSEILREWRNIDLLIHFPEMLNSKGMVFAIEIKVESSESDYQLEKYTEIIKDVFPDSEKVFVFLTPDATEGSHSDWVSVGFSEVLRAIEDGLALSSGTSEAKMMVESYVKMMKRKYVMTENDELEKLAEMIWQKHSQTLDFLLERKPLKNRTLVKALTNDGFIKEINQTLNGFSLDPTNERKTDNSKLFNFNIYEWKKYSTIFEINDPIKGIIFLEIFIKEDVCRVKFVMPPANSEKRRQLYDLLINKGIVSENKRYTNQWTTLVSKTVADKRTMEEILEKIDKGEDVNKQTLQLKTAISDFCLNYICKINEALLKYEQDNG